MTTIRPASEVKKEKEAEERREEKVRAETIEYFHMQCSTLSHVYISY